MVLRTGSVPFLMTCFRYCIAQLITTMSAVGVISEIACALLCLCCSVTLSCIEESACVFERICDLYCRHCAGERRWGSGEDDACVQHLRWRAPGQRPAMVLLDSQVCADGSSLTLDQPPPQKGLMAAESLPGWKDCMPSIIPGDWIHAQKTRSVTFFAPPISTLAGMILVSKLQISMSC